MATVKKLDIWNELISILNTAKTSGSLTYIKEILEGTREDIPQFPVIILEPVRDSEVQHTVPEFKRMIWTISITAWALVYDRAKQITGEVIDPSQPTVNIGVLNLERDIKNTLDIVPDLNGKAIRIWFPETNYVFQFDNYPYRAVEVLANIEFITQAGNR